MISENDGKNRTAELVIDGILDVSTNSILARTRSHTSELNNLKVESLNILIRSYCPFFGLYLSL